MAKLKVQAFESVFSTEDVQVNRMVLAPGEEVPWHFHNHVRDTFYVLRGPVTIFTREPEATITIDNGETFQTRDRQPHRVVNAVDHDVSVLLIQVLENTTLRLFHPRGEDDDSIRPDSGQSVHFSAISLGRCRSWRARVLRQYCSARSHRL